MEACYSVVLCYQGKARKNVNIGATAHLPFPWLKIYPYFYQLTTVVIGLLLSFADKIDLANSHAELFEQR